MVKQCHIKRYAIIYKKTGLDLRLIQVLLGHGSSEATEIYTYAEANTFKTIKNPLD